MTLHPDIERLALLGWRLHPSSQYSRAACIKGAADAATYDLDQLHLWAREFRGCNWRVVMGGSGIWALDVDVPSEDHEADGVAVLRCLIALHGQIPERPMTRSGGGGFGLFFQHRGEPIIGRTGTPAPGLDPRRGRLTITVPPSVHVTTRRPYRWITPPWELSPPPAPDWLLRLVAPPPEPTLPDRPARPEIAPDRRRRYALAALRHASDRVALARPGSRSDTLNAETFALTRLIMDGFLDASEVATTMAYAGRQAGLQPIEVKATLVSAIAAGTRR
jgi:hypothetical protein